MIAMRRLKSGNQADSKIGLENIIYLILFFVPITISYFLYDRIYIAVGKEMTNALICCLGWISITFLYAFHVTKDYKNINNIHKGTLQYYIYDINMPNKLTASQYMQQFMAGAASALSIFSLIGLVAIFNLDSFPLGKFERFIYLALIFMWAIFCIRLSSGYLHNRIKSIKISEEKIKGFLKIEEIDKDEKQAFLRYMKNIINENNIVTKEKLYDWCIKTQRLLNEREYYAKKQESEAKIKANKVERHEYQDILDFQDLND